ncbi:GGDEF domain-containing protein [Motilibacter deserti]|uniref:Diguanylate cyclase n=1 Tax=Motilibacter deserti TaxID=2714956 RepID=A0ABX0GYH5_9ACTN|nr:sensor domain-containing diguanylate cyclase [Motilibacter deserti]NHC15638.1 diguanylate cyclase [Motilibacter deserti]
MSRRLWLVVGALVVLPVLVGSVAFVLLVGRADDARRAAELSATARAVSADVAATCRELGPASRALAAEAAVGDVYQALDNAVTASALDYAAVAYADDAVAQRGALPADVAVRAVEPCGEAVTLPVVAAVTPVRSASSVQGPRRIVSATAARVVDAADLRAVVQSLGLRGDVVIADGDEPLVSTLPADTARDVAAAGGEPGEAARADGRIVVGVRVVEGADLRVVAVQAPRSRVPLVLAAGLGVVVGCGLALPLGWLLARRLLGPLLDLADASERMASGDLGARLPEQSDDEVGRVGRSLNRMTAEMREYHGRLGEALGSTHDLAALARVVLESAMAVSGAQRGGVYVSDSGGPLSLVATRGSAPGEPEAPFTLPPRLAPSTGALGSVVREGREVYARLGPAAGEAGDGELAPGPGEPAGAYLLAVPMRGERSAGVLALFDKADGRPFGATDAAALLDLSTSAGTALDNVLRHREAKKLSITDPLTGLWNFRYLSMSLAREIERATRFERSLAVLMLDLDHFKQVNDTYGHQRGDAVLREFAERVGELVREVDILARYGGEEFVLVLPETTIDGATMLAERIRLAVRRSPVSGAHGEPAIPVTVSIGIAAFPGHGSTPATLMRAADAALYEAKGAGRDCWRVATGPAVGRQADGAAEHASEAGR